THRATARGMPMNWSRRLRIWRRRFDSVSKKEALDRELGHELAFHLEQLVKENTNDGMDPVEARHAARRTLGSMGVIAEECRDQRRVAWVDDFVQDVRYGLRMLRKNPGFTAVAAVSLALGIGANTAVLGVADAFLMGSLPIPNADR